MRTLSFEQLESFAVEIAGEIAKADPFCLWLSGDLGAGKTTITGYMLRALGLSPNIPVTSPTFTYFNEYQIGSKWYGHMDLYRADGDFVLEELGVFDTRSFSGYFIEWPEQIPKNPILEPTHELTIALTDDPLVRSTAFRQLLG